MTMTTTTERQLADHQGDIATWPVHTDGDREYVVIAGERRYVCCSCRESFAAVHWEYAAARDAGMCVPCHSPSGYVNS